MKCNYKIDSKITLNDPILKFTPPNEILIIFKNEVIYPNGEIKVFEKK